MKEKIETIPVNEAFRSEDECPFCYLERQAEQRAIRYTLGPGASYMEPLVRGRTDTSGFCGTHMKKLFDYGNSLGNALILQTYYVGMLKELDQKIEEFSVPHKKGLFGSRHQDREHGDDALLQWEHQRENRCFLCESVKDSMHRYYSTFFFLLKEAEFRALVESGKGFCMCHFAQLLEAARVQLPNAHREWFYKTILPLMRENLARVQGDLDWFIQKFDYRNAGADWKNSKDAVSRAMQKLWGIHPADPSYKEK